MRRALVGIVLSLTMSPVGAPLLLSGPALAQSDEELAGLRRQIEQRRQAGKYADALPLAQRLVAATEQRFGANHVTVAASLNSLAIAYEELGLLPDAERTYRRTLAIIEKSLGAEHQNVGVTLGNLAIVLQRQGRYAEALPLAIRSLAIAQKAHGPDHPSVAISANTLASVYESQGRYAEAEALYKRSLAIREKAFGPEHRSVGSAVNNLAGLYVKQGRGGEAEPLYKRSLSIAEKTMGPDHPALGTGLNNLGLLYQEQGRYAEAETLFKRDLAIQEKLGLEHPNVASALNNIGLIYHSQGRYSEALPLYERALAIRAQRLGPNHPQFAESLINLAELHRAQSRFAQADPLYRRGIAVQERVLGPEHPNLAVALNNFAELLRGQGRAAEAEPLYKRSLAIREKILGSGHPDVAQSLNNLALVYGAVGRYSDAEQSLIRALAILERTYGANHPNVASALHSLAWTHFAQRDWKAAHAFSRRALDITIHRARRDRNDQGRTSAGSGNSELARFGLRFALLVKAAHRLAGQQRNQTSRLADESFVMAQWALGSAAATSVAQMSAREAKGSSALARVIRERQDLVSEWLSKDKLLTGALSRPVNQRNQLAEEELRKDLASIDGRIARIDATLAKQFPEYAALANPEPLAPAEAQAHLRPNEALVVFFDTPSLYGSSEETFAWAVTKTQTRLVRLEPGTHGLTQQVQALRCGLDHAAWEGEGERRCKLLLQTSVSSDRLLPFDLERAHGLYRSLFGQIEDLIKDKHLLLAPSGPLTALPFQVLVTEKPASAMPADGAYSEVAWLARRHATTVLPSVASLKALRQFAKASKAAQPFVGFGNPLLLGPSGSDRRAWEHQSCKAPAARAQVVGRGVRSAIPKFFRGGLANVEEVRAQHPLPETADELCAVAHSSGAGGGAVHLGAQFSEKTVKALSASGTLASARVVHFATHGLLAGETEMLAASRAEPALIMTPPQTATEDDDGLLTASEIAQLKLDADWVVLSACNTAAGDSDAPGTEALSGLARAFFYAGARAALVSHWAVNSEATVSLITKAFDEIKADPSVGRAEALRRAMIALIETGGGYAHPASWAPFVVVGEGAH
jgi:CHAT domain-containing protein/tetratricopeptide (TPR) repeat protein